MCAAPTITVLPTLFDGIRFRSRTEARWAVFFKTADISFEYEREGYALDNDALTYLPDFHLPTLNCWLEVKGSEPSALELKKCRLLADGTDRTVLMAIGQPQPKPQILVFFPEDVLNGPASGSLPEVRSRTRAAYAASWSARFTA